MLASKIKLRWQSQGGSHVVGLENNSDLGKIQVLLISWGTVAIADPTVDQGITVQCHSLRPVLQVGIVSC